MTFYPPGQLWYAFFPFLFSISIGSLSFKPGWYVLVLNRRFSARVSLTCRALSPLACPSLPPESPVWRSGLATHHVCPATPRLPQPTPRIPGTSRGTGRAGPSSFLKGKTEPRGNQALLLRLGLGVTPQGLSVAQHSDQPKVRGEEGVLLPSAGRNSVTEQNQTVLHEQINMTISLGLYLSHLQWYKRQAKPS